MKSLPKIADNFFNAFYEKKWNPFDETVPIGALTVDESYLVQDLITNKRLESGESVVGYKVGCTSKAIRAQFNLNEPINGKLFEPRIYSENVTINLKDYVDCAIEPEMVLKIGKTLVGENLPDEKLLDAIEYVSPGIELHNFRFWNTPPTIQELICSGGIHAGLVIGKTKLSARNLSLTDEVFRVYKNKTLVTSALAVEIMGGPLHSLRWLVSFLTKKGLSLKEDSLVIPGSPTELVNIVGRTVLKISIDHVGSVTAFFEE
jgi:2-keto-4-pentenoate hydratase